MGVLYGLAVQLNLCYPSAYSLPISGRLGTPLHIRAEMRLPLIPKRCISATTKTVQQPRTNLGAAKVLSTSASMQTVETS
jgi:hypothetical protein